MFSYRHVFHAGNHADVLKHIVLVQLLEYLQQKQKAFTVVDTHAGAAIYDLNSTQARKRAESETGIARLWSIRGMPAAATEYLAIIQQFNPGGRLVRYPGSGEISRSMLRTQDQLRLFELHNTESRSLEAYYHDKAPQVIARAGDGFAGLRGTIPPPSRRGLVLIDPSYEDKSDYQRIVVSLRDSMKRFSTGIYAVWYPLVRRREAQGYCERLKRAVASDWLNVSLTVRRAPDDGLGLYGSGLFLINPPWPLPSILRELMPFLVNALAQDPSAGFTLESSIT